MPENPNRIKRLSKSDRTRSAILDAARRLFAERGYDGTTIREVAAIAALEPAMVIRYFGSKDGLFVRAAAIELELPAFDTLDQPSIGESLLRLYLDMWEGPRANNGLVALLRTVASNELAARKIREVFATQVLPALARVGTRATAGQRDGLVASQLLGLALCRYILKFPPIAKMPVEELIKQVAPTIQRYALGEE